MSKYITDEEYNDYKELSNRRSGITVNLNIFSPYGNEIALKSSIDLSDDLNNGIKKTIAENIWAIRKFFFESYERRTEDFKYWKNIQSNELRDSMCDMLKEFNALPWYKKIFYKFNVDYPREDVTSNHVIDAHQLLSDYDNGLIIQYKTKGSDEEWINHPCNNFVDKFNFDFDNFEYRSIINLQ